MRWHHKRGNSSCGTASQESLCLLCASATRALVSAAQSKGLIVEVANGSEIAMPATLRWRLPMSIGPHKHVFFASGRSFDLRKKAWRKKTMEPLDAWILTVRLSSLVGPFKDETRKLPLPLLLLVFRPWFSKGLLSRLIHVISVFNHSE